MEPTITIYSIAGEAIATAIVTQEAVIHEELMTADYVKLSWSSATGETLPAGAYIEHDGERYSLLEPYTPQAESGGEYRYEPEFQSRVMAWGKQVLPLYTYEEDGKTVKTREMDWDFTGSPADAMYMVEQAIRNETGEEWQVELSDSLPATITISSQSGSILSALNEIASECETEWWADKATNTLYLSRCQRGEPVALTAGGNVGVPSVTESKDGYYTRFYVFGSTRNVTQDSGSAATNSVVNKRLTLDPATYPGGYIDAREGLLPGEIFTAILTYDDIYPSSRLEIGDVRARLKYRLDSSGEKIETGVDDEGNPVYEQYAIWYFQIPGLDFDPDTIIPQKTLSVHFESGQLAGRDFELAYHEKASQVKDAADVAAFQVKAGDYEIIIDESEGMILPGLAYIIPQDGDKATLYNIEMPAEYTASAQAELAERALKDIARRVADNRSYEMDSNPVAFKEDGTELSVGQAVNYAYLGVTLETRVLMVERHLDFPWQAAIRVGNELIKGNTQQLKEEVTQASQNIDVLKAFNELSVSLSNSYANAMREMQEGFARIGNMWRVDPDRENTIYSDFNAYVKGWLSAKGANDTQGEGGGGGGLSYSRLDTWEGYSDEEKGGWVLSAYLGVRLHQDIENLKSGVAMSYAVTGTGNAITDVTRDGSRWVFTKGKTFSELWHTHTLSDISDLHSSWDAILKAAPFAGVSRWPSWGEVTGKPTSFTPSSHTHAISQVSGLQAALDAKLPAATFNELFEKVTLSTGETAIRAKLGLYSDKWLSAKGANPNQGEGGGFAYTRLDTWEGYDSDTMDGWVLSAKLGYSLYNDVKSLKAGAAVSFTIEGTGNAITDVTRDGSRWVFTKGKTFSELWHTHTLSDISDLHSSWDAILKAAPFAGVSRWPSWGEVTGKPTSFTPSSHTHAISQVSGLQAALDAKLPAATFNELFEKVTLSTGETAIRAKLGLYSDKWLSAKGANPNQGEGGGFAYTRLDTWEGYDSATMDGWVLSAKLGYSLYNDVKSLKAGAAVSFTIQGTGNAITDVSKSGTALVFTRGTTFALASHSHPLSNISDLNSGWDSLLKTAPSSYVTRWPSWSEVSGKPTTFTPASHTHTISQVSDLHASWDAILKAAPSGYVTRWPSISEVTGKQSLAIKLNGGGTEGTNLFTYNGTVAKTVNITPAAIGAATSGHTHSQYLTSHQAIYALTVKAGTTSVLAYNPKTAAATLTIKAGTNVSLSADAANHAVTINGTYTYTHPSATATTIAAATGRVLSAITVNSLGHVTSVAAKTLAAADIPTLAISKISGLQSSLDSKLAKATFDDLFEKVTLSDGTVAIHAKYGLYSDGFVSGKGANPSAGEGGGAAYNRLDTWEGYTDELATWVLSAGLGYSLYNDVKNLKQGAAVSLTTQGSGNAVTDIAKSGTKLTVTKGLSFLTAHQNIFPLTIQGNGTAIDKYTPNSAAKTINITPASIGAAASSHTHSQYLTSVSLATISDLHSSWDAVLKAQKPNWLTSVSLATISDLHSSWDAVLKAAPSAYVTRWPNFSEVGNRPSTLSGYGIADGVNAVSVTGSGNAVSAASVSGHTLTLTKGLSALTSHQAIYALTLQGTGSTIATYNPKSAAATINLSADTLRMARGNVSPQTGRTQNYGWLYSYNCVGETPGDRPSTYMSVVGFGRGTGGTVEIGGCWVVPMGLWYRALRDYEDDWYSWRKLLDSVTYTEYTVTKTGGGASGTWGIGISGNAATASKWQTKRTISLTGAVTGSVSLDGSGNVSLATTYATGNITALDSRYLLKSAYTAADVLAKLKTVDGSGSGLDADLLDGTHKSGLFTAFSANGNSTRITIGGVTKDLTVPYASNADTLDGLHGTEFLRLTGAKFAQYNQGTWTRVLQFTQTAGSYGTSITFSWLTCETARDIWADFNIDLRQNAVSFKAVWKGTGSREMKCVGDGTTYSVWVKGTKTRYDPYGIIQVTNMYAVNSYNTTVAYTDTEPTGTYSATVSTQGIVRSATQLLTARTINGTSFNGTSNIVTSYWGTARNIAIASSNGGGAGAATSVNGSANVTLKLPATITAALSGNASTASKLQTARTLWGRSFDGSANVSGDLSGVGNISASGVFSTSKATNTHLAGNQGQALVNSTASAGAYVMLHRGCSTNGYFTLGTYQGTYLLQYTAKSTVTAGNNSVTKSLTLLNEAGNSTFPGTLYAKTGIYSDGYVSAKGQNTSSDMRLKDVLGDVSLPLERIAKAPAFEFRWRDGSGESAGSSAQYWKEALPSAVRERGGYLEMQYGNIALISAISIARETMRVDREVTRLREECRRLRRRVARLEGAAGTRRLTAT